MHRHIVFNANSSDTRHVNPRFDGNHVPWHQDVFLSTRHSGILVDFESQSMSRAVHEIVVKPVTRQNPSGGGIDIPRTGSGLRRGYRSRLRFLYCPIPSPYARRSAPHKHGPRNIAAIVGEYNTQVQYHQFIFPQALLRWPRMWVR